MICACLISVSVEYRLEDPLPELTSDSHVYIQPPAPLLADAPGGEAIVVWHYDITSLAVVQFGHPFVVSLQAGHLSFPQLDDQTQYV